LGHNLTIKLNNMREIRRFGYLVLGASLVFGAAACGSSNDGNDSIQGGTDPGKKTEINTELTPEQQKQKLDEIAKKALSMVKTTDFNTIENIANYVNDNLTDKRAMEKIDKWRRDKLKSFWSDLGKRENDMKVMQRMIDLSQIKGHFKVVNGQWVREDANDLQFTFNDNNGKECVLKLVLSGKQTNMYVPFLDDEKWEYKGYGNYDRTKIETKLNVPEHATLTLARDGNALLTGELNTKVSTNGTFDVAKDNIEANCKLTINNYAVEVKRALFEAGKGAKAEASITVGGNKLVSTVLSINAQATNERIKSVGEVNLAFDVLGEVQFKGNIDDGSTFNKSFRELERGGKFNNHYFSYYTENEYKSLVNEANKHLNIGIFFNGSKARNATIELGAYVKRTYINNSYNRQEIWSYDPIFKFSDNTTYAFNGYFTKKNFPDVFEQASKLIDSFERMFNK